MRYAHRIDDAPARATITKTDMLSHMAGLSSDMRRMARELGSPMLVTLFELAHVEALAEAERARRSNVSLTS